MEDLELPPDVEGDLGNATSTAAYFVAPSAGVATSQRWSQKCGLAGQVRYGEEKVANREIRVWHGATENGP
jgi:hypothetical protein